ncbi:MAG: phage/plasmid primase, P4 family [Candidatus Sedimenticola sp. PURPLELP]
MVVEGGLIDTTTLINLTTQEESKYAQLVEAAKQEATPRAEKIRAIYRDREVRRLVKNGVPRHRAKGIVASRMDYDLLGEDVLHFDSLGTATVNQVMSNLAEYDGATLADPIEPDYGRGKAILFAVTSGENPIIHSFAHGGRVFTLWYGEQSLISALDASNEPRNHFVDLFMKSKLNPEQQAHVINHVKELTELTKGEIKEALKAARNNTSGVDSAPELSHDDMAQTWLKEQPHPTPVGAEGSLWVYQDGCWEKRELTKLEPIIATRFNGQSRCARKSEYKQIAQHIYDIVEQPEFFEDAPVGVACPSGFFSVTNDGEIHREELTPDHRQRFRLPVDPVDKAPEKWLKFLENCFFNYYEVLEQPAPHGAAYDGAGQISLLQEIMGGVILGTLYTYEKAVLLYGLGSTGKSTLLRVIEALVPEAYRTASDPFLWGREYFIADLAGKRLNSVGELPDDKPIPASEFKRVTGRDTLQGRHPTHRPFNFKCTAAHLFNSNHLINTRDQSNGFWRRWLILGFFNVHPDSCAIKDLDQQLINKELGKIIHWALLGGIRLKKTGVFTETKVQRELMSRWRKHTDSVAEFIAESDEVSMYSGACIHRTELYKQYQYWCETSGRRFLSSKKFYDRIAALGIIHSVKDGYDIFRGIGFTANNRAKNEFQ